MTGQFRNILEQLVGLLYKSWGGVCQFLQMMGLLPSPPTSTFADQVELVVAQTFRPVEPSESFRASLRDNLQVAIQHQADGMVVEYPYVIRYRVVLGVSAGVVAAALAALVLIFKPRPTATRH